MQEFTVGTDTFMLARKLDSFKQLDMAMRLAPILAELIPVVKKARTDGGDLMEVIPAIVLAAGKLTEESRRAIIIGCLECVQFKMRDDKGWAFVAVSGGLMRQDLSLPAMLVVTWKVLEANIVDFSSALAALGFNPSQD